MVEALELHNYTVALIERLEVATGEYDATFALDDYSKFAFRSIDDYIGKMLRYLMCNFYKPALGSWTAGKKEKDPEYCFLGPFLTHTEYASIRVCSPAGRETSRRDPRKCLLIMLFKDSLFCTCLLVLWDIAVHLYI